MFPNKRITSHSFRQTLISELLNNQISPKTVAGVVSHANVKTTLRYHKVEENNVLNALDVL